MKRPRPPRFLARRSYRRRRLIDAARLLPVLGFILIMVPILWRPGASEAPDTAFGGLYLFAVWFGLIGAAWLVARILARGEPGGGEAEADEETR